MLLAYHTLTLDESMIRADVLYVYTSRGSECICYDTTNQRVNTYNTRMRVCVSNLPSIYILWFAFASTACLYI